MGYAHLAHVVAFDIPGARLAFTHADVRDVNLDTQVTIDHQSAPSIAELRDRNEIAEAPVT